MQKGLVLPSRATHAQCNAGREIEANLSRACHNEQCFAKLLHPCSACFRYIHGGAHHCSELLMVNKNFAIELQYCS